MIKRTIFFGSDSYLSCKNKQLLIQNRENGETEQVPIEDIGYIVFENPAITISQFLLQELIENNVAVVFCNSKRMPSSMLLNLDSNQIQSEIFSYQINASEPLKKQLWQQTVKAKIRNQAMLLGKLSFDPTPLENISKKVKSGDTSNEEAKAARIYWRLLFGEQFRRDRYGKSPNSALNYGYAILRAVVARALAGSGLLPTLGIHHHNRYNSFCLADDIMEPFRPFVDRIIYENLEKCNEELSKEIKAELLKLPVNDVFIIDKKSPLMIALSQTTASLARCFSGDDKKIIYPVFP